MIRNYPDQRYQLCKRAKKKKTEKCFGIIREKFVKFMTNLENLEKNRKIHELFGFNSVSSNPILTLCEFAYRTSLVVH